MGLKSNLEIENHQIYTTTTPKTDKGIGRASNPNSVVNPNGADETPTDKLIVNSSGTTAKSTDSRSAKEINQSIAVMCQKYSLDVKKLKTGIENITGLVSDNDKSKLTEKQQAVLLSIIENSMQKAIQAKETGKRDDIDVVEAVLFDALLTSEIIIKKKTFKDLNSLDNDVQENAKELLDAINNIKSVEEFEALKSKFEAQIKEKFEKEKAAIQKLPENERAAAIKLLEARHQDRRQRLLSHYILPSASKEIGANALTIANSEDTGRFAKGLYKMQATDADRQELAVKYHSFGLDEKILKAQKERGEEFNQESWQEYVQVNSSWKDENSLTEYHNQVMSAAEEGKLAAEVLKATHQGIGVGAQINHVMTSEQKTAFVEKWTSDVKEYYGEDSKEYKELKSYVEQKVEEYNKGEVSKQEVNSTASVVKPEQNQKMLSQSMNRAQMPFLSGYAATNKHLTSDVNKYNKLVLNKPELTNPKSVDVSYIRRQIAEGTLTTDADIKKAIGANSNHEVVTFLAKDPVLRITQKARIRNYISNENPANGNLQALAEKVPVIIPDIMNYMRGDKQKFAEQLISQHKVSYDRAKGIEKEIEDENGQKISV